MTTRWWGLLCFLLIYTVAVAGPWVGIAAATGVMVYGYLHQEEL